MVKLHPVHGLAAETTGATLLSVTALLGMPVSTTHAVTASIMGVGADHSGQRRGGVCAGAGGTGVGLAVTVTGP